jgi:hypothetical protein
VDDALAVDDDLDAVEGDAEQEVGLDEPSPLLTRVAELIVMTGPIFQVGWARACSGVTS